VALQAEQQMVAIGLGGAGRRKGASNRWLAAMAVDESLRNLVCTGAQVGAEDSVCALSVQWRGESPDKHAAAAQELVETLEALKDVSLSLAVPIVGAAASFSQRPQSGLLVCHALGRLRAFRWARSADFKSPGDAIYLLGPECRTLLGSLFAEQFGATGSTEFQEPQWALARRLYGWLSGVQGKEQGRIRSLHDVSEGGLLVAVTEGLLARGLGAQIRLPEDALPEAWAFGEGFHRMVLTCSEADSSILESEWGQLAVPFSRLGTVTSGGRLDLQGYWSVEVPELRKAWRAEESYS
jgi:phosphoribosylformylglycinamidine (FGAM) synthase-like enzyme